MTPDPTEIKIKQREEAYKKQLAAALARYHGIGQTDKWLEMRKEVKNSEGQ